ncbi:MAG: hypothetical protein KDC05_11525 [Bacteroidales bacterium]|nr:hypothetical protein [Bacteroidales bacterium]
MHKVIVTIEDAANADLFLKMVKQLEFVDSAEMEEEYDWLNPKRPATDEESEQMIREAEEDYEAGRYVPIEDAKKQTIDEIEKWLKNRGK